MSNRCFPWKHLILQPPRLSHALLGFIHLEPSIACSWASSKLDDIGLLLRTEKLLGATSLCGPSGFRKAYFACPGRTPKRNLPVTCQGVAGPDVCFWQCWADTSICQVCLFMTPSRQLEKRWKGLLDLRKKVVRKEREEGEALAKLRFPSDISEHVVFFASQVRRVVCILSLSVSVFISISLPLPLPLWELSLYFSLESIAFYFFVLGGLVVSL